MASRPIVGWPTSKSGRTQTSSWPHIPRPHWNASQAEWYAAPACRATTADPGEPGESTVAGDGGRSTLDSHCGEVRVRDEIPAGGSLCTQLGEDGPMKIAGAHDHAGLKHHARAS